MTDRDIMADHYGITTIGMDDTTILDIGLFIDIDDFGLTADHGIEPNRNIIIDQNIPINMWSENIRIHLLKPMIHIIIQVNKT